MKRTTLSAVLLLGTAAVVAQTPSMVFTLSDGSTKSIPAQGLEITFSDTNLNATSPTQTLTLPLQELTQMELKDESGVTAPEIDPSSEVTVHTLSGILIGSFSSLSEAAKALPSGIYIVTDSHGTATKTAF